MMVKKRSESLWGNPGSLFSPYLVLRGTAFEIRGFLEAVAEARLPWRPARFGLDTVAGAGHRLSWLGAERGWYSSSYMGLGDFCLLTDIAD